MDIYQRIKSSRRLIWAGIVLTLAVAIAIGILNYLSDDGSWYTALAFALQLSIPATFALFALDRRPSLLTAATMSAVLAGLFLLLSGIGLVYFLIAALWYFANARRPRAPVAPTWAVWGRPLLAAVSILPAVVMFMHLDPRCTTTSSDGTVTVSEASQYPSGWSFGLGSVSTSTGDEGESTTCSSDTVRPWEALASVATSAVLVAGVSRWPTAEAEREPSRHRS